MRTRHHSPRTTCTRTGRTTRTVAVLAGAVLLTGATACSEEAVFHSQVSDETDPAAAGISVPADASLFRTSATGPDLLNPDAPADSPMAFVDPALLDGEGRLPEGMTVTEAQSLQVLSKIDDLLTDRKLKLYEVGTVRAYLAPDGRHGADFDGWERAYRRYFANIDRDTGRSLVEEPVETTAATTTSAPASSATSTTSPRPAPDVAVGAPGPGAGPVATSGSASSSASSSATTEPTETTELYPGTENRTRPTLVTVGVAQQPVAGWLVQVEIEAVHGEK